MHLAVALEIKAMDEDKGGKISHWKKGGGDSGGPPGGGKEVAAVVTGYFRRRARAHDGASPVKGGVRLPH